MIELSGKYNKANVFTLERKIEEKAKEQILGLLNESVYSSCRIKIMPDYHSGKGSVVGLSMTMPNKKTICPNLVGVDIGCGVLGMQLKDVSKKDIDLEILDRIIRDLVPIGFGHHPVQKHILFDGENDIKKSIVSPIVAKIDAEKALLSMGTLGGGNHFIEIGEDPKGRVWLLVHSGSRKLGLEIAHYYQELAIKNSRGIVEEESLAFLSEHDAADYLSDLSLAVKYAEINRLKILETVANAMEWKVERTVSTVHNTISPWEKDKLILRKGCIAANKGESVLISMNMAEGTLLGIGKGEISWNCSAPHGAGRLLSRTEAKKTLKMEKFEEDMESVFSTCIDEKRLDEAPAAYKPSEDIIKAIGDTVNVVFTIKPFYNLKG